MKNQELLQKLSNLKILATDFDGVWTDGKVYFREDGMETVLCDRRDTNLLKKLTTEAGVYVFVISKETNPVVEKRCKKMGIDCHTGIEKNEGKKEILERIAKERSISLSNVAFMGDDVNDIQVLKSAGIKLTVSDGHNLVKKIADYTTKRSGGNGAIREITELILESKNIDLLV